MPSVPVFAQCNINVYNIAGCVSDATTVSLRRFQLSPVLIEVTACVYETIPIGVTPQQGVQYEWSVSPPNIASIIGSHTDPTVSIYFNESSGLSSSPRIVLKRISCLGETISYIDVNIQSSPPPSITIQPNPACAGDPVLITANSILPVQGSTYRWVIDGILYATGTNSITPTFTTSGEHTVTLYYNAYPNSGSGCEIAIKHTINVREISGTRLS